MNYYTFPDPHDADPDGVLCVGGDLSIDCLLQAYSQGIFPWYSFRDCDRIVWYCPQQRFVIFPDEVHVSHSMRTLMNKNLYEVTFNEDFKGVISNCSKQRYDQEGAWLGEDMIEAYTRLHDEGLCTSVEVWERTSDGRQLMGGLYGVDFNHAFFGESMFSLKPNTSKLALIRLAERLKNKHYSLIDCQLHTNHLASMGGKFISYDDYISLIYNNLLGVNEE